MKTKLLSLLLTVCMLFSIMPASVFADETDSTTADSYIAPPVCVVTVESETPVPTESAVPTEEPTPVPTESAIPTEEPTPVPTESAVPTEEPTPVPTESAVPTEEPTPVPTESAVPTETPTPTAPTETDYKTVINDALEKISATYINSTSEWIVMDMGAYENYASETENKLTNKARQEYINSAIKSIKSAEADTVIAKAVLGLVAIGKNPEKLYSANSNKAISAIDSLNKLEKSTSAWSAPYTLAVYNQADYDTDKYETEIVNTLIANQKENGSWDEFGTIDTTANVIAGLSFYKDRENVQAAIEKAVNYLSTQQNDDGTFSDSYSGSNSSSTAMVVIGLSASGIDLQTDARFIKNDNTIIDGLLSFLVSDHSGFGFINNESVNDGATEQSFRALIAAMQTIKTGNAYNIYDFSSNEFTPARATGSGSSSSSPSDPSGDDINVTVTIKADTGYWLKNYKVTIGGDDATVYHAFVNACSDNSIKYEGASSGYISSMTKGNKTLAEFGVDKNSGWLYKVNGEVPTESITEYEISDGDEIVFYYTNDWTKDPSAGRGGSSLTKSENKKAETTPTPVDPKVYEEIYKGINVSDWQYADPEKTLGIGTFMFVLLFGRCL